MVPFGPTANDVLLDDVSVWAALEIAAAVSVPVKVGDADKTMLPVPVTELASVTPPYVRVPVRVAPDNVGDVANTTPPPEPVGSEITPRNCVDVVDANCDKGFVVTPHVGHE